MAEERKIILRDAAKKDAEKLDKLEKGITGYGRDMSRIIDPEVSPVDFDNVSASGILNSQDNLFNARGNDRETGDRIKELMYASIISNRDEASISEIVEGRIKLNVEFNYLLNNMPPLGMSLDALADDVVYPNISTKTGIQIKINGNDAGTVSDDNELLKYFRPNLDISTTLANERIYNFDIETEVKHTVFDVGVYGYQIVSCIPYKSIVNDILYEQSKVFSDEMMSSRESTIFGTKHLDFESFSESMNYYDFIDRDRMKTKYDIFLENASLMTPIAGKDLGFNKKNLYPLYDIFHFKPYLPEDVEGMLEDLKMDKEEILSYSGDIPYMSEHSELNKGSAEAKEDYATDGLYAIRDTMDELKEKRKKKFNIDNIKGCTYEVLDNTKTVPVFIKGQLLGVYVLSEDASKERIALGRSLSNLLGSQSLSDSRYQPTYNEKLKEAVLQDMETILRRNVDKKFIRNNPNLIEDLEYILTTNNTTNPQTGFLMGKIRFIPGEYLVLHKIGKGDLGTPLMAKSKIYAKMYIQLMKSDLINKVYLEKPRYKVGITSTGDLSSSTELAKAMMAYRNAIPRLSDGGVPDNLTDSVTAAYQSVLVPRTPDGEELLSIDEYPVFKGNDNSEFLRELRNQATLPLGTPADLLDPSQNIDFARKITNINMHVLIKVLNIQKELEVSMSKMCTKRLRYMTGNNKLEVIIKFENPREITDNITSESISKARELLEVYSEFIDNDARIKDEDKERFKVELGKELFKGVLDTTIIEEMYKDFVIQKK